MVVFLKKYQSSDQDGAGDDHGDDISSLNGDEHGRDDGYSTCK